MCEIDLDLLGAACAEKFSACQPPSVVIPTGAGA
jgi:hypothetical protein